MRAASAPPLQAEFRPASALRLPSRRGGDRVLRIGRAVGRLLHVDGAPVVVRAWQQGVRRVWVQAEAIDPRAVSYPAGFEDEPRSARREQLELAIERARFMFWLDDDLRPFFRRFRGDPLLGRAIHLKPWMRPRRRPWPWEALAWAITEQLIEASRASRIQRRIVRALGPSFNPAAPSESPVGGSRVGRRMRLLLTDVPGAATIATRAPAEFVAMDLSEARSLALVRCARETRAGRARLEAPDCETRLLSIREIGPWTVRCLGFHGRGEPDSLPAGDLAYVKLVGHLAGLGRRATVEEVEEFFAPYRPYRGLAGYFALVGHHKSVAAGPPLRAAA